MVNTKVGTGDAPRVNDGSDMGPVKVPPLWRIFTVDDGELNHHLLS